MMERVLMPPVIDIMKMLTYLNKRGRVDGSLYCRMAVRLLDKVNEPVARRGDNEDVEWYRAGMLWLELMDRDDINKKCAKLDNFDDKDKVEKYINALPDTVIPYGLAYVAVSKKEVLDSKDLLVTGRVGIGVEPNKIYVSKVSVLNQVFYSAPCIVSPLALAPKTREQTVLYANLLKDKSMGEVTRYLKSSNNVIPKAGIDKINPLLCNEFPPVERAQWEVDNTTLIRGKSDILSINNVGIVLPSAPVTEVNGTVESFTQEATPQPKGDNYEILEVKQYTNLEKGVEVRGGRVYYNRREFYVNEKFVTDLRGIMEESTRKVNAKMTQLNTFEYNPVIHEQYLKITKHANTEAEPQDEYKAVTLDKVETIWDNTITAIKRQWKSKPILTIGGKSAYGTTGRMLLRKLLNKAYDWFLLIPVADKKLSTEDKIAEEVEELCSAPDTLDCMSLMGKGYGSALAASLENWSETWYMLLVATLLDISYNFNKCLNTDSDDYIDNFWELLGRNPYDLIFYLRKIHLKDLDKLAMLIGVFCDNEESIKKARGIAYMHDMMLSENHKFINSRTCVPLSGVYKWFTYGFTCSAVDERRRPSPDIAIISSVYVDCVNYMKLPENNFKLKYTSVQKLSTGGVLYVMDMDTNEAIKEYKDSGWGIEINFEGLPLSLCDYSLLSLENNIFEKCLALYNGADEDGVSADTIDELISRFEVNKAKELGIAEFKLEAKQREAAHMVNSPIMALYGGAGTGKTTTAEVLLYLLQEIWGVSDEEILFIAPTGRAAVRLKEVVKRPTSTIHRALKLNPAAAKSTVALSKYRVIIVDENSMITVQLMENLLKAIPVGTRVYFLGDIAQLLPIGFGKPFANMLRYIPCVTLEVGKRAKSGSKITSCANDWLSTEVETPIQDGDDLKCIPTTSANTGNLVLDICKHYLNPSIPLPTGVRDIPINNITPNDIQICTPFKKKGVSYGTSELNPALRDMFNPYKGQQRIFCNVGKDAQPEELRVGDRVIHTDNDSQRTRYSRVDGAYYEIPEDTGVMNGDIGIIVDIVGMDEIERYNKDGELRKHAKNDAYKIALVVEYSDVDLNTGMPMKYSIVYSLDVDSTVDAIGCFYVTQVSRIKTTLELAYALTVHKLQGSEAKLVIFPFFAMGKDNDFMCNELVYTGMTRGRAGLYMLGDVCNPMKLKQIQNNRVLGRRLSVFDLY